MTMTEQDVLECYDEDNKKFDWDLYQQLCVIADYWNVED